MPLPPAVIDWRDGGEYLDLAGLEVFCRDTGPPESDEAVVILHGFPSSSFDWRHVITELRQAGRVVSFDFPGYGLSAKPAEYGYSLFEQADLVQLLLRRLGIAEAKIISHNMGTSVACELAARRMRGLLDFEMESLVLMNGSVYIEMARLTPSQRLLLSPLRGPFTRFASYTIFRAQLKRILGRPIPESEHEAMWAQINHRGGRERLKQTIAYIHERRRFRHRWVGALRYLDIPVHVIWGPRDPVAVPAIAERLAKEIPGARLQWLDGLGHYPMIEDPEVTARALLRGPASRGS